MNANLYKISILLFDNNKKKEIFYKKNYYYFSQSIKCNFLFEKRGSFVEEKSYKEKTPVANNIFKPNLILAPSNDFTIIAGNNVTSSKIIRNSNGKKINISILYKRWINSLGVSVLTSIRIISFLNALYSIVIHYNFFITT